MTFPSSDRPSRFVAGVVAAEPVARWQLLALLWAVAGVVGVAVGLLDDRDGVSAAGAVALGAGVLLAGLARQLDPRLLGPLLALGTAMVSLTAVAAGSAGPTLLLVLVWAGAAAWYFLSPRGAGVFTLYAIGLACVNAAALGLPARQALAWWLVTALSVLVVAGLAAVLRARADGLAEQLRELADRDGLTGVLNRHGFSTRVALALARQRRNGEPVALVLAELDHFREAQGRFGQSAGDALLRRFAAYCDEELRAGDAVARVGGERFALLLPEADAEAAAAVAERIRRCLADVPAPDGSLVTASFGVACAPLDAPDADGLLDAADAALHAAKRAGHDLVLRAGTVWPARH